MPAMDNTWLDTISALALKIHGFNDELSQWTSATLSSAAPSLVQGGRPFSVRQCAGATFAVLQASMISLINADLTAAENQLIALLAGWLFPVIISIAPNSAGLPAGTPITISGAYLQGATAVLIGGIPATNVQPVGTAGLQVTAVLGTGSVAGPADVQVTTQVGIGIAQGLFTYLPPVPVVTSISPNHGSHNGGTAVTITGTNFLGATAVSIGGVPVTSFTVVNATTITAVTGVHAAGLVPISVTTAGGTGVSAGLYTYQ